ncbi:MAG: tRNA 2-thiouridine(34) synthase MnmA [Oscillospiraceae bacterium]|jgi:tRNA-specific 2-thiouridylase|nr:tRNA 2-thiouridine(34) synthase MnmA [Oscillospiraceae bacterium]
MKENKVLVGMSGGVDSAAAAVLLGEAGYEAVGCTLRLYDGGEGGCCSLEDVEDARSICRRLGMDFFAFNFSDLFRRAVVDDFVSAYQAGRTPNPCIQCNRHVKFAALLRRADELEIGHIATGHYARVDRDPASGRWRLLRGLDRRKDQSYVLYPLTQGQLSRLLLPLGAYDKASVRALAEARGLCNARKPDSQDICFVPDGDYPAFLRSRGTQLVPGDFVDSAGRVLGRHRGLPCYTAGQRRGLGVSADRPLYVLRKDAASNTVVLGDEAELYSRTVWAEGFNWVSLPPQEKPIEAAAKTRYSQSEASGVLYPEGDGLVRMVFDEPQRAVTAGQSLVCYQGDAVAGGGTICRAAP